ncbi:unnamed protein product [Brassica oleracea]|uniref:(rape) hypothetical protein n=1 Tax=Brassica napus TaxID=3708 RepID=A0A816UUS7_BRANA|nr:unnamed protein product [Brassica napus]
MRILAARLANHFRRGRNGYPRSRDFSSLTKKEDLTLEEEAERKIGWMLKLFFAGTATYVGYQFFPYMGDTLIQQSVSLLHVKDPLFKRIGASRLSRFAIDDERRMKVVELGGAQELLHMLGAAKDDKTRKEALKALAALSKSGKMLKAKCIWILTLLLLQMKLPTSWDLKEHSLSSNRLQIPRKIQTFQHTSLTYSRS